MVKKIIKKRKSSYLSQRKQISFSFEKYERFIPWMIIGLVLIIFGADFIFAGKVFLPLDYLQFWPPWNGMKEFKIPINNIVISDVVDSLYPFLRFFSENLKAGHFPHWNPLIFLGFPALMMNNIVLNPLYLILLFIFPAAVAHSLGLLINLAMISVFSYLFFKERGLSAVSSLAGSVVFTFNGHLMVWAEFALADSVFALTAVFLYFYERSVRTRKFKFIFFNGLLLGFMMLGTSQQWYYFVIPLLGAYAFYRTIEFWIQQSRRRVMDCLIPLIFFAIPLIAGVLIGSPFLLPTLIDYIPNSQRVGRTFEYMCSHTATFYPELFLTFIFPNLFGYQPREPYFARGSLQTVYQNYNEVCVYVGIASFILLLIGLTNRRNRTWVVFCSILILFCFVIAMKAPLIYSFLFHFMPGVSLINPTRSLILLPPLMSFLTALGMNKIYEDSFTPVRGEKMFYVCLSIAGVLSLGVIITYIYLIRHPVSIGSFELKNHFSLFNPHFFYPLLLLLVVGLFFYLYGRSWIRKRMLSMCLLALMIVDLMIFGIRYNTRSEYSLNYPLTPGLQYIKNNIQDSRILPLVFHYNTFMAFNIPTIGGYNNFYPATYRKIMMLVEKREAMNEEQKKKIEDGFQNYVSPVGFRSRWMSLFNAKYFVTPGGMTLPCQSCQPVYQSEINVYLNRESASRAFVAFNFVVIKDSNAIVDMMYQPDYDFRKTVVLEETPTEINQSEKTDFANIPLNIQRQNTDRIKVTAEMPKNGILVLSEQFFPGWKAKIDGKQTKILKAFGLMMAVIVPQGHHQIEFVFSQDSFLLGLKIMIGTLFVWVFIFLIVFYAKRINSSEQSIKESR